MSAEKTIDVNDEGLEERIPNQAGERVTEVLDFLVREFEPAADFENSELSLTTKQIFKNVQEHCPGVDYNEQTVFSFFKEHNFVYAATGDGMEMVWLLKRKR